MEALYLGLMALTQTAQWLRFRLASVGNGVCV
jgi:hypothetical protein